MNDQDRLDKANIYTIYIILKETKFKIYFVLNILK